DRARAQRRRRHRARPRLAAGDVNRPPSAGPREFPRSSVSVRHHSHAAAAGKGYGRPQGPPTEGVTMDRRTFLAAAAGGTGALFFGRYALAAVSTGPGPYGALGAADANGIRLPAGFTSRVVARSGQLVSGTGFVWHVTPDGGGCFPTPDSGW